MAAERQAGDATLQGCDALFEHTLRGIGRAAVDVTRISQAEAVCGVLGIVEHIGSSGVNRHCAGVGCGSSRSLLSARRGLINAEEATPIRLPCR